MIRRYLLPALAATLILFGCSQEQEPPATAEEPQVADPLGPDLPDEIADEQDSDEAVNPVADGEESLEVVEESAADIESDTADEALMLAKVDQAPPARNWQYQEGRHFGRMVPTQPTVGGADKIEVAEAFMYMCGGCYSLEAPLNAWADGADANVRFVRIPVMFSNIARTHAQLYYTEYYLAQSGKITDPAAFRQKIFDEYHLRGNRLGSEAAIQRFFASEGISKEDFERTWGSFEVNQAMRVAEDLVRRYGIGSVPTIVVNGKYKTDPQMAGGYEDLFALVDELTVREGLR